MKVSTGAKKIIAVIMMCCCLFNVRQAQAFIWPTIDIAQISSFVSNITNGLSTISNAKSQLDNIRRTIKAVGDQIAAMKKYVADLKGAIAQIKESINSIVEQVNTAINDIKETVEIVEENVDDILNVELDEAVSLVQGVEHNVEEGAPEEETQAMIDDARAESEKRKEEVNKLLDTALTNINKTLDNAGIAVDELIKTVDNYDGLDNKAKEELKNKANDIKNNIDTLKKEAKEVINQLKENYNEEYSEKIAKAYDEYSKALNDYYAGKIDINALKEAGSAFKQSVESIDISIDDEVLNKIADTADKITSDIETLKEDMLNAISNDKEYSDEDEEEQNVDEKDNSDSKEDKNDEEIVEPSKDTLPIIKRPIDLKPMIDQKGKSVSPQPFTPGKTLPSPNLLKTENIIEKIKDKKVYAFKYRDENKYTYAKSLYDKSAKGKPFIISKEFLCKNFKDIEAIAELKNDSGDFRTCVARAKIESDYYPDAEKDSLYKNYLNEGVYKHILKDYSAANLITASKMKQEAISWRGDGENQESSEYEDLKKKMSEGDVDNTLNGVVAMGMIDLWAPRLWSYIRRVDAVNRAKNVVQMFELDETLHIDGREDDVTDALNKKNGEVDADGGDKKKIFPHVMLYHCDLKAKDISIVKKDGEVEGGNTKEAEEKILKCLEKYASGASRGFTEGSQKPSDSEYEKKRWKEKQKMALNDAAFENLTLSVITNYNSSLDYKKNLDSSDGTEVNIVTLQDGLKDVAQARDGYAAAAQINYYATQQLLNVVDTDATDLQMEILKDLQTYDYSYFLTGE